MKSSRAFSTLTVLWALVVLKRENKTHSVKNILDFINGKSLTDRTVKNVLDYLEDHRVIVCPYPKGQRQGKSYRYVLFPFNVPEEVLNAKYSYGTSLRWFKEIEKLGVASWGRDGKLRYNGDFFDESKMACLVNIATSFAEIITQLTGQKLVPEFNPEAIVRSITGQVFELPETPLRLFHIFICSQFINSYPEGALSQIADLMESEGA